MKSASLRYYVYQCSDKTDNFEYLDLNLPKTGFWGRNSKNLWLDSESESLRYYVHQFPDKINNFGFLGPNLPKNEFWGLNFKNVILDSESTPALWVPIFSQNWQHLVFPPKFEEIAQLPAIFWFKYCWGCCRELGGGGWRWMHSLVIPFDDIFKNLSLVVSYTPVMLHSQWHYWSSSLHKGYPWYKVPSHTISRSWDTSGGRGVREGV